MFYSFILISVFVLGFISAIVVMNVIESVGDRSPLVEE